MIKYLIRDILVCINKFIIKNVRYIRFCSLMPILLYEKIHRMDIIKYIRK